MTVTRNTPPAAPSSPGGNGRGRRQQSALANPVLVGAMTVLVVLVAVFLAYNANNGLPFVPTRELKVNIASGSDLVPGDEVSEGGFRIGVVSALNPIVLPTGQVAAQLTLQLNQSDGKLPIDSTAQIRPRSVLGLKYVDLHRGTSKRIYADGGTMPITQTSVPVQFEDLNQMFDAKTRTAVQDNLVGFGNALAGRGSALNDTIASLPRLFLYLRPVAANLANPSTGLTRFLRSLERVMGTIAPVAQINAELFTKMATTFEAISHSPSDLEQTIKETPSTEAVVDAVAQGPAAVPRQPHDARQPAGARDLRAQAGAAGHQPGDRDRHQDARAHAGSERRPAAGVGRAQEPVARSRDQRRDQRPDEHGRHAEPDGPLPRPVPDRVRRLELLLDLHLRSGL